MSSPVDSYAAGLAFYTKKERLATFKTSWPFNGEFDCNPGRMAEAGWYSCGTKDEPDVVKCFACNKEMNGWEQDDNPWTEHKKHCPECPFVLIGKKEAEITVYEHLDLAKVLHIKLLTQQKDLMMAEYKKVKEQFFKKNFPQFKIKDFEKVTNIKIKKEKL